MTDTIKDTVLYERVVEFVRLETKTRRQILGSTDIARDLGVDGDDAVGFFLKFRDEFDVDLSQFKFDVYFGSEGFKLFPAISSTFGWRRKKAPVTVDLLFNAARDHSWSVN